MTRTEARMMNVELVNYTSLREWWEVKEFQYPKEYSKAKYQELL